MADKSMPDNDRWTYLKFSMWEKHRVSYGLEHARNFEFGEYTVAHTPAEFISLALHHREIDEKQANIWRDWGSSGWLSLNLTS